MSAGAPRIMRRDGWARSAAQTHEDVQRVHTPSQVQRCLDWRIEPAKIVSYESRLRRPDRFCRTHQPTATAPEPRRSKDDGSGTGTASCAI